MTESLVIVSRKQMLRRICGEYLEMPGLRLTRPQAQRLWGLDEQSCALLLESLTEQKFLYRRDNGMYALSRRSCHIPAAANGQDRASSQVRGGRRVSDRSAHQPQSQGMSLDAFTTA